MIRHAKLEPWQVLSKSWEGLALKGLTTRIQIIEQHGLHQSRNLGILTILAAIFVPITAMAVSTVYSSAYQVTRL